jgi:hypothetical protein
MWLHCGVPMASPMHDGHLWQCGDSHACGGASFAHSVHCLVCLHAPIIVYGAHKHGVVMFDGIGPCLLSMGVGLSIGYWQLQFCVPL